MNWWMIRTIYLKDMRDAIRDARVLVALIVPFSIGIFYNLTFDDETDTTPRVDVVYAAAEASTLPDVLREVVGETVDLTLTSVVDEQEVTRRVYDDDEVVGLIIPAGFDEAVRGGRAPPLRVVLSEDPSFGAEYAAAAVEPAVRQMAGQGPVARIELVREPEEMSKQESVFDQLGLRKWSVLVSIVMMIGMISMLAVPVILAEEVEKKTMDALVLVASYLDVVAAKALLGISYIAVMVPLLLALTNIEPENIPAFAGVVLLLGVTLLGFGLLMGGLFRNANQLNTWSGVLLLPVVGPAFAAGISADSVVDTIITLIPTGAAAKLLMSATSGTDFFGDIWLSVGAMVAWGAVAYAVLLWDLNRRRG